MKPISNVLKVFIGISVALVLNITSVCAEESSELATLRKKHELKIFKSTRPILKDYLEDLKTIEKRLLGKKDTEGVLAVLREKAIVEHRMGKKLNKEYSVCDDHRGRTGHKNIDNVFKFNLKSIGQNTELIAYMHGLNGYRSNGKIFLKDPLGEKKEIGEWDPPSLEKLPTEMDTSYRKVKPSEIDITRYVTVPGNYEITFQYIAGPHALIIQRVEIITR